MLENPVKALLVLFVLLFALLLDLSCARRHAAGSFRVLPANPDYLLRSPDSSETPFPELLNRYNGFIPGKDWLDLRPQMELWIENAYYRQGAPKRGLANFPGTETAKYQVRPKIGLRLISIQSHLQKRPPDQPPVQKLIRASQQRYRYYRFFYAIVFRQRGAVRSSVLLGAASINELDRVAALLLSDPDSVCGGQSTHCTVFPAACTVSLEIEIVVNGARQTVPWGSPLASIAAKPRHIGLVRLYNGRLTPVEIDPTDSNALRLPLLPGDQVDWE